MLGFSFQSSCPTMKWPEIIETGQLICSRWDLFRSAFNVIKPCFPYYKSTYITGPALKTITVVTHKCYFVVYIKQMCNRISPFQLLGVHKFTIVITFFFHRPVVQHLSIHMDNFNGRLLLITVKYKPRPIVRCLVLSRLPWLLLSSVFLHHSASNLARLPCSHSLDK